MTVIRFILGKLILLLNWVFTPRGIKREPELQARIDQQTASLKLVWSKYPCGYCRVLRYQ